MRFLKTLSKGLAVAALAMCATAWADPTLTLSNGGTVVGDPGQTVGWGFTLSNSTNFVVVDSSDFCVGPVTTPCTNGGHGSYTDIIGPNFVVVGNSAYDTPTLTEAYDAGVPSGVGSFSIFANQSGVQDIVGQIVITYDLYSVDPNDPSFDPTLDLISTGNTVLAPADVLITPEPASMVLLGTGLLGMGGIVRRKFRG